MLRLLALLAVLVAAAPQAAAHVTELAVVRITAMDAGTYRVVWEMRPTSEFGAGLEPVFPPACTYAAPVLDCAGAPLRGEIGFEGIGQGQSAAMIKLSERTGPMRVYTLTPAQPTAVVTPALAGDSWAALGQVALAYLQIGIEHILAGIDHLLFVLGLVWIAGGTWRLVKTITAFTIAHTVTLTAVTFGWVGVPEGFVNAMIALSIVFVGVEIVHAWRGQSTVTLRYPWAVAFGFGLLHGFGFANALVQLGLPDGAVPVALLAFNLGVEIGQIAFVLVVLALAWAYREMRVRWPGWASLVPAYAIGGLAAFWFIDRSIALIGA